MENKKATEIKEILNLAKTCKSTYEREHGEKKDKKYDKTYFFLSTKAAAHNLHSVLYLHNYSGTYGSSNVGSSFPDSFARYLSKAVNKNLEMLTYQSIDLMREDAASKKEELKVEIEDMQIILETLG